MWSGLYAISLNASEQRLLLASVGWHYFVSIGSCLTISGRSMDPRGSRLLPPPSLQRYLRPRVTLSFDPLTPKVDRFMPLPRESLMLNILLFSSKSVRFQNITFTSLVTDRRTDGQTGGEHHASVWRLARWRHKNTAGMWPACWLWWTVYCLC